MADSNGSVTTVYQYFDRHGQLLYVGVTARNIRRAVEHAETKEWWTQACSCSLEHYATREAALEREAELIRRYCPPFNTVHNTRKAEARAAHKPLPPRVYETHTEQQFSSDELKRRRAAFYEMTPDERKHAMCVQCGERPVNRGGPSCAVCKPVRPKSPVAPSSAP